METVEVVIRISKEVYEWCKKECEENDALIVDNDTYAIGTGIPLPKGHGKLGDLDALRKEVLSWGMNDYEPSDFTEAIDQVDTIIEADKEVSE